MILVLNLLSAAASVAVVLYYWFEKDFFPVYMKLFNLTDLFWLKEYYSLLNGIKTEDYAYLQFLAEYKYEHFMVKLLICPVCFSFWLALIFSILYGVVFFFPIIVFLGLTGYYAMVKFI